MGDRGSNDDMKNRRTNLEAVVPEADKPDPEKAEAQTVGRPAIPQRPEVRLGREVQARIGQQLRAMYDDVVNQGVPSHITDLVRRLSEQE
jgi:aromatic ring-cleaving dioxygenase